MANYFDLQNGPVLTTPSALTAPKISTIGYPGDDTAADTAGGQTITLTGSGFAAGASVIINGAAVGVVSVVSSTTITFTSPAQSAGSYVLYVVNTDGGTAIAVPGIQYSGVPTWTTAAGSLGSYTETVAIANTVTATGDAPITYSVFSGSLPTGATLNSANGYISGTSPAAASPTTYTFTIRATDGQQQDTNRSFSLTINPDVVTWSSPANGTTYTSFANSAISNVALSATAASGKSITYTANALPTGLSISGSNITGTPTVVANSSTLLTATANTTNATATRTINWVISVASDTYFPYVTTLLSASTPASTFVTDASTNAFNVTVFGDTRPSNFGPYTPGYYSNYFDGTGDYLTLSPGSAFAFGTGDFTVECWYYPTSTPTYGYVVDARNSGQTNNWAFAYGLTGVNPGDSGKLGWFDGSTVLQESTVSTRTNSWNHLCYVRSGTTGSLFVNGVRVATATNSTNINVSPTTSYICQRYSSAADNMIFGYISNLRTVKGTAVYDPTQSTLTVPTAPLTAIANTSLLTCQSNRFIDNSTNNFTISRFGDTLISGFDPFLPDSNFAGRGSGFFDGTGDYLAISNGGGSAFDMGTGNCTIEMWVYPDTQTTNFPSIFASSAGWSAGTFYIRYSNTGAANKFGVYWNSVGDPFFTTTNTYPINVWYHVALVRNGTTFTLYINGVADGTGTSSASLNLAVGGSIWLGNNASASCDYKGLLSNVRIVKGTAVYTTNFTPPSTPLTAIANTQLLTLQNNQPNNNSMFLDSSTNNFNITRNGNTTQGSFSPYSGGWSAYFDGNGDTISAASNANLIFGTGDFTVECWINSGSQPGSFNTIIGGDTNGAMLLTITGSGTSTGITVNPYGAANVYNQSYTFTQGTWFHIAVTRSGTSLRVFVNGTQLGSTVTDSTNFSAATRIIGGAGTSLQNFAGYVSNARIVKGTAVYTSNFTPPTAPLTPIANTQLLTCADNRFIDDSPNNFAITRNGDTSIQRFNPFNPVLTTPTSYSGYFDGTGDFLSTTGSGLGSGNFTIEMWVYMTSYPNAQNALYSNGNSDNANASTAVVYINSSGTLAIYNYPTSITTSTTVPLNQWNHIAVVRNSGTITLYINGVSGGSGSNSNNISNTTMQIMQGYGGISASPIGYVSNVRVVVGTAVYTANFTPSTSPLTAIANTALLTCQSATFTDNSTNNFTITGNGNSAPRQFNPFGWTSTTGSSAAYTPALYGGSAYFDGTGDSLAVPANSSFATGTGDFTIEGWIYVTDLGAVRTICGTRTAPDTTTGWNLAVLTNGSMQIYDNTGYAATGAGSVVVNTWYHFAFVRQSNVFYSYLNGVRRASSACTRDWTQNTFWIGATGGSSEPFLGYISDIRMTKAQARYTSNFQPPVAPLTALQNTVLLNNMTGAGIYDSAMMNNYETVGNSSISTSIKKYGNTSMYFDGTGDYLIAPSSPNFAFGTGDFTIECWLYLTATGADDGVIIEFRSSGITGNGFVFNTRASGGGYVLNFYTDSAPNLGSTVLSLNAWNHVAVTRSGSTVRLFSNGAVSATITKSNNFTNSINPTIGQSLLYANSNITGYIDDLRITKGIARYTTTFTPPTTPFIQN